MTHQQSTQNYPNFKDLSVISLLVYTLSVYQFKLDGMILEITKFEPKQLERKR